MLVFWILLLATVHASMSGMIKQVVRHMVKQVVKHMVRQVVKHQNAPEACSIHHDMEL